MLVPAYPHLKLTYIPNGWLWEVFVQGRLTRLGHAKDFLDAHRAGEQASHEEWEKITEAYDSLNDQRLDP